MTGFSHKAQKIAQGGMKFFFAPQLGMGASPTKGLFVGFVQMVAQFMAGARLLPATHRALNPLTVNDARLGEVIAVSYANLRRPGAKFDQYFMFAALVSFLGLITLMAVYSVTTILMGGVAHAGFLDDLGINLDINVAAPACTLTGGPGDSKSYFAVSNENCDTAQQWINVLILGKKNWVSDLTVSAPVAAGLEGMFSTYSSAMLVLGGFLVLYHMLSIVAGTAHEGKLGGRVMNQIWAPIRLVTAIGLLVPVGVHGLNSGQLIVAQVAKAGSALASNIWIAFADEYSENSGSFVIGPPVPDVKQAVGKALDILICQHAIKEFISDAKVDAKLESSSWVSVPGSKSVVKTWDYVSESTDSDGISSNNTRPAVCGVASVLDPGAKTAARVTTYIAGISFSAGLDLRSLVMKQQKNSFDSLVKSGGLLDQLAQAFWEAGGNGANSGKFLRAEFATAFNNAAVEYQNDLSDLLTSAIASSQIGDYKIKDDAMGRGWMSASVWFNTIARYNGMVLDFSKQVPYVEFTYNKETIPFSPSSIARLEMALGAAAYFKANLSSIASTSADGIPTTWVVTDDTTVALSNKSGLEAFLDVVVARFKSNLGGIFDTDSGSDISVDGSAFASMKLGSANPLAELSSIGLRLISVARESINKMNECTAAAAGGNGGEGDVANELGCKKGDLGIAYFLISSVVGSLIAAGITLGYVLPMLPFIRFMFGVLTWVMALFETVIAIPVVALGHIKMDGEGLSGPMARGAYMLLLQLFLRPTLMIFGLIAALLIFNLIIVALNEFYTQAVVGAVDGGGDGSIAVVIYTVMYGSLAYAFANASFKAIDMIPNQCLHWIGGQNLQTVDESHRVMGAISQTSNVGSGVVGSMTGHASRRLTSGAPSGASAPVKK